MVYTGRGDEGNTDLASGERVSKSSERIDAYGTVDELNSLVGLIAAEVENGKSLKEIQNELHIIQAELADMDPDKRVEEEEVERLEQRCDHYQSDTSMPNDFVLAGGSKGAAYFDLARSVARRAERKVVALHKKEELRQPLLSYINRLSDLFYLMARHTNHEKGVEEKNPDY